ncbi:LCP family protein [Changpingibacter yushuensis]|uniref:LCP family protein n=1 Tax=Changpingibacter yushuensis TaxID=2758440 RepID=UPI00165E0BD1|nr:LCP family protein [Changpingibacter yushuensis]
MSESDSIDDFLAGASDGNTPKKKTSGFKVTLLVLTVILAMVVGTVATLAYFANRSVTNMQELGDPFAELTDRPTQAATTDGEDAPINFLIMGSDSRISAGDVDDWKFGAQRTDALMLLQISGDRQHIAVMSIPRDSWVTIEGFGEAKINAAYSYGGPALTIKTVEQLTGVHIDHIAAVDFTTFEQLTDIVGGVDVSTTDGTQHLNGADALKFVRERYSLPRGDFDRVRRQQLWMSAVMKKVLSQETLSSPTKIMDILNSMSEYVSFDDSLGITDLVSLGSSLRSLDKDNIIMFTAPVAGTGTSDNGQSIVNLDMDALTSVSKAFQTDTVSSYVALHSDSLDTLTSRPVD